MFVVPDFMAPAFSCVMARRWRTPSRRRRRGERSPYATGTPSRRCLAVSVVLHQRGDGVAVSVVLLHRRGDGVAASVAAMASR